MLEKLRERLSTVDALPQLTLLGLLTGVFAGLLIVLFRLTIEYGQSWLLGSNRETYEQISSLGRFLLPLLGSSLIVILFIGISESKRRTGLLHVIERLEYNQGRMGLTNALVQFFGGALCIISGHSVGREGPSIHLGAAAGSSLGRWLDLPNNSIRVLVGCGTAAAIAASFNTPISGIIFAMEVVLLEYSVIGFLPVIVAAIGGTVVTLLVYGNAPAFSVPPIEINSLVHIGPLLAIGLFIGLMSAGFNLALKFTAKWGLHLSFIQKSLLAGLLMGICGMLSPEVMGIGYDTVENTFSQQMEISTLLLILSIKFIATVIVIGLGMPGGLIGPVLFLGAVSGSLLTVLFSNLLFFDSPTGFYAVVGMGAMMGATLHAPLAALMAILELTANPHFLFPTMICVVTAQLVSSGLLKNESAIRALLHAKGLDFRNDPIIQSLRRLGIVTVMKKTNNVVPSKCTREKLLESVENREEQIIVTDSSARPVCLLPTLDATRALEEEQTQTFNLLEIPAKRQELSTIKVRATLQEALDKMHQEGIDALAVCRESSDRNIKVYGYVTKSHIEDKYRYRH
ncbi:MAG TPA: voltage-gated chloride channel [Gammaproteobacteria bacterium]|nr:voltage-gated chloride channel [Gammaproteobacteria bacterium]